MRSEMGGIERAKGAQSEIKDNLEMGRGGGTGRVSAVRMVVGQTG